MVKKKSDKLTRLIKTSSLDDTDEFFLSENKIVIDVKNCDMLLETKEKMDVLDRKALVTTDHQDICSGNQLDMSMQQNRMRLALSVLARLVVPLCNGVLRGIREIRSVRVLKTLTNIRASRQALTNMLAYAANTISMSLSSVQVVHRIDPILKIMKLKKGPPMKSIKGTDEQPAVFLYQSIRSEPEESRKCVTLNVLAEPPADTPIRADIIFIHGLHGSLVNTWKQGLWKKDGRRVQFERAPRPPIRPPKRPRHSRSTLFGPPHLKKRARYGDSDNVTQSATDEDNVPDPQDTEYERSSTKTYEAEMPEFFDYCDNDEYSFPTFRLRLEEHDRLACGGSMINSNNGSPVHDKKSSNTQEEDVKKWSACWPGDWLPLDCPGVRVIALNYTTDPYLWRPLWVRKRHRTTLTERTREMTDLLIEKRVGHGHPIIWVGHSKGGLFIKQILVDAWDSGRPSTASLWRSSKGVFFYSVPHRGSPMADFNLPLLRQSIELVEIQTNCASILELHRRFVALYQSGHLKIDVFSFVETALTLMSVLYLRIVGADSADPGIGEVCGVHLDHREICKPRNRNCILYTTLTKMINKVS